MNIFQIQNDLLELFNDIEEAGGEITPEQEEKLNITQELFSNKVKDYTNVIKIYKGELNTIKDEVNRLQELYKNKEKIIERLEKIILAAIEKFGSEKSNGVKYLDYGTGIVSTRTSTKVLVNENVTKAIARGISNTLLFTKINNQLDVTNKLDSSEIIQSISSTTRNEDGELELGYLITNDDLNHMNVEFKVSVPVNDITEGKGYNFVKELAKYTTSYDIQPKIDKTKLKKELTENGSCAPTIARLETNKSLVIK